MITITNAAKKMLDETYASKGITKFQIERVKPGCAACREQLLLFPGGAKPGYEAVSSGEYIFFIKKAVLQLAQSITIDTAGGIPVLFSRSSIDAREH